MKIKKTKLFFSRINFLIRASLKKGYQMVNELQTTALYYHLSGGKYGVMLIVISTGMNWIFSVSCKIYWLCGLAFTWADEWSQWCYCLVLHQLQKPPCLHTKPASLYMPLTANHSQFCLKHGFTRWSRVPALNIRSTGCRFRRISLMCSQWIKIIQSFDQVWRANNGSSFSTSQLAIKLPVQTLISLTITQMFCRGATK